MLGSIYFLFTSAKTELAPQEDQGVIITQSIAAPNATLQQRQLYSREVYRIFASHPETDHVFQLDVPGQSIAGMVFKPWDERAKTTNDLQPVLQQELSKIAGVRVAAFQPPPLPGSFGLPVQFVIATTDPFARLNDVAQQFLQQALAKRHVHLPRLRSEDRQSAIQHHHRSRQDRAARPEDERRRRLARRPCSAAAMSIISASAAAPTK